MMTAIINATATDTSLTDKNPDGFGSAGWTKRALTSLRDDIDVLEENLRKEKVANRQREKQIEEKLNAAWAAGEKKFGLPRGALKSILSVSNEGQAIELNTFLSALGRAMEVLGFPTIVQNDLFSTAQSRLEEMQEKAKSAAAKKNAAKTTTAKPKNPPKKANGKTDVSNVPFD